MSMQITTADRCAEAAASVQQLIAAQEHHIAQLQAHRDTLIAHRGYAADDIDVVRIISKLRSARHTHARLVHLHNLVGE